MENEQIAELERIKGLILMAQIRVAEIVRDEFWALENDIDERIYELKRKQDEQLEEQAKRQKEAV